MKKEELISVFIILTVIVMILFSGKSRSEINSIINEAERKEIIIVDNDNKYIEAPSFLMEDLKYTDLNESLDFYERSLGYDIHYINHKIHNHDKR